MSSSQGLRNVWYFFVDQIILEIQVNIFDTFLFDQPVGKPDSKKIFIVEIVVRFIVKIPEGFPLQSAGPVFCAGVTMFSPLCTYGANKGHKRVGIVGIGGLGQMGVQLAKAMGNTVTAISTSPNKKEAAMEIGADNFVVSTSKESMAAAAGSLDLIINTVSAEFDVNLYLQLLVGKFAISIH